MSAFVRWLLAMVGAALIVFCIIGVFVFAESIGRQMKIDDCLDRSGVWDYTNLICSR